MKFMNMKRFGSIVMAGALALSMAAPAFATYNTTITGSVQPITLRVTVPTTGAAIINPYGLPYTMATTTISGQQIVTTAPLVIQNKSSVALSVAANVTGTASNGVILEASSATTDYTTAEDKKLQVKFEAFTADTLTALNVADTDVLRPLHAALDSDDAVLTADVTTTATNATGTLVLREGKDDEVQSGGAAMFRLSGKVAKKAAWAADDTFGATIAFTFEPGEYTKSAGTIALSTTGNVTFGVGGSDTPNGTATLTPALPTGVTAKTTVWDSSEPTKVEIVSQTATTATLKAKAEGASTITVTIEGSDGLTYISTLDVTAGNNT